MKRSTDGSRRVLTDSIALIVLQQMFLSGAAWQRLAMAGVILAIEIGDVAAKRGKQSEVAK